LILVLGPFPLMVQKISCKNGLTFLWIWLYFVLVIVSLLV
jgi:hypothetical protein